MGRSFFEFCKNHLFDKISDKVRDFVEGFGGELQDLNLCDVSVYNRQGMEIGFDIVLDCRYSVYDRYEDGTEENWDMLLVQGCLDLGKENCDPQMFSVGIRDGMPEREFLLNDRMVPRFSDLQCVDVAHNLLEEFYPEHLKKPGTLNVDILIGRMGLQLVKGSISQQGVKSRIFLFDGDFEGKHYKAGTILVDERKSMEWGFASHRFNLVHECVHWYCHRKWALWELWLRKQALTVGTEIMEWELFDGSLIEAQTNKITGMVLAPVETLNGYVEFCFSLNLTPPTQEEYLSLMPNTIDLVKCQYGISKACAKIRLQQCKVYLADGFENYRDGQRVRDYVFNPDVLPKDGNIYTFTISEEDVLFVLESNTKIKTYMESGVLLFVENHIVVNSPKFVEDTEEGYILTDYALTHMDECALRFYTIIEIQPNEAGGGSLGRKNGGNSVSYCQVDEELNVEYMLDENTKSKICEELENMSSSDFPKNLRMLLKNRGVKQDHLQNVLKKSGRTIARMFSEKHTPTKEEIIDICLALKLPWEVSEKLFRSGGFILVENKDPDFTIRRILTYCTGWSYEKKLKHLGKCNIFL